MTCFLQVRHLARAEHILRGAYGVLQRLGGIRARQMRRGMPSFYNGMMRRRIRGSFYTCCLLLRSIIPVSFPNMTGALWNGVKCGNDLVIQLLVRLYHALRQRRWCGLLRLQRPAPVADGKAKLVFGRV